MEHDERKWLRSLKIPSVRSPRNLRHIKPCNCDVVTEFRSLSYFKFTVFTAFTQFAA
jgi:hypothetical protein